ncbi:hypothetical protein BDW67DRAFT_184668 [Aspergillus spinulosporus]
MLLRIECYWWWEAAATFFIVEAGNVEIFLSAMARFPEGILLRRNWPTRTFMGKGDTEEYGLPMHRSQSGAATTTTNKEEEKKKMGDPAILPPDMSDAPDRHNLCESAQYFWTISPGLNPHSSTAPWSTHYVAPQ